MQNIRKCSKIDIRKIKIHLINSFQEVFIMGNPIYEYAKKFYGEFGIDTEKAIETTLTTPISLHCWQGDDVKGFEGAQSLDGGIQATGNYPGAARTPAELMADLKKAMSLMPGALRLNLHANYAIFKNDNFADRDQLLPEHFEAWADFAVENGLGLDFNPLLSFEG